jgi:hypothetical protein
MREPALVQNGQETAQKDGIEHVADYRENHLLGNP